MLEPMDCAKMEMASTRAGLIISGLLCGQVMLGEVQFPERPAATEAVKDLILRMTDRNPVTRIKLEDICSHAWVAQVIIITTAWNKQALSPHMAGSFLRRRV